MNVQKLSTGLNSCLAEVSTAKYASLVRVQDSVTQVSQVHNILQDAAGRSHAEDKAFTEGIMKATAEAGQKLTGALFPYSSLPDILEHVFCSSSVFPCRPHSIFIVLCSRHCRDSQLCEQRGVQPAVQ